MNKANMLLFICVLKVGLLLKALHKLSVTSQKCDIIMMVLVVIGDENGGCFLVIELPKLLRLIELAKQVQVPLFRKRFQIIVKSLCFDSAWILLEYSLKVFNIYV